jgi:hypothetical protein
MFCTYLSTKRFVTESDGWPLAATKPAVDELFTQPVILFYSLKK